MRMEVIFMSYLAANFQNFNLIEFWENILTTNSLALFFIRFETAIL